MLSWLWDTLFGDEAGEPDDTVGVSVADLSTVSNDTRALRTTITSATDALAATEKNARLFYQSIEELLMESYDTPNADASVSPDSTALQEMRTALEEQRETVLASMMKQKEAIEERLFRAQMQLKILETQARNVEASARELDNPSLQTTRVVFPAPVAAEFETSLYRSGESEK